MTKIFKLPVILAAILTCFSFGGMLLVPDGAMAASSYKCKGTRSGTGYSLTLKKGKVRVAGGSYVPKILSDGAIEFVVAGEAFTLGTGGAVLGRGGRKIGKHNCDLATARTALQK